MTEPLDRVEELLDAYLDYLEGLGEEPSLDHLGEEERAEAEQLIASLRAAQGIDPYSSPPSVADLLARAAATQDAAATTAFGSVLQATLRQVDRQARVVDDVAAQAAGLQSALVAFVRGLRIRVIIEAEGRDIDTGYAGQVPAVAGVFGALPDTNVVLLAALGDSPAGAIVDRDDIVTAIETPSGQCRPPRISRPVMDPVEACVRYVYEVMPAFEPFEYLAFDNGATSVDGLNVENLVAVATHEIVTSGERARLTAKKTAWTSLGPRETGVITDALHGTIAGHYDEAAFRQQIEALVGVA